MKRYSGGRRNSPAVYNKVAPPVWRRAWPVHTYCPKPATPMNSRMVSSIAPSLTSSSSLVSQPSHTPSNMCYAVSSSNVNGCAHTHTSERSTRDSVHVLHKVSPQHCFSNDDVITCDCHEDVTILLGRFLLLYCFAKSAALHASWC